ncbi:MAG: hypothetical protein K5675_01555 [Lachnospiraceae bacterium]|nr:hypothetical protein [Lachnospiraceae bacterium]
MAIKEATDETFDSLIEEGLFLVDFYTTHCGPCRSLLPTLLEVEGAFPVMNFIKVNLDHCPGLRDRFMIDSTPTLFIGKDGTFYRYEGYHEKEDFLKALTELYYGKDVKEQPKVEEVKQGINREGKKAKVRLNEDADKVREIQEGLKAKNGYCPCRARKTPENKCMCKEFRDQIADESFEGYCHCKLYYKEYV